MALELRGSEFLPKVGPCVWGKDDNYVMEIHQPSWCPSLGGTYSHDLVGSVRAQGVGPLAPPEAQPRVRAETQQPPCKIWRETGGVQEAVLVPSWYLQEISLGL